MNTFSKIALEHFRSDAGRWEALAEHACAAGDTTEFFSQEETAALRLATDMEAEMRSYLSSVDGVSCEMLKASINLVDFYELARAFLPEDHAAFQP